MLSILRGTRKLLCGLRKATISPGLVLEGGSLDALIERVRYAAPELIELNDAKYSPITNRNFTVDSKIKSRHTANAIMKQAGIDYHF